jgi:hypothetical protein
VFRQALGLQRDDAAWLRAALLEAASHREGSPGYHRRPGNVLAARRRHQATSEARGGKDTVDCANRRGPVAARDMLGSVMKMKRRIRNEVPSLLDVVALLKDLPARDLTRGQVGTAVEQLADETWLVEFSDDEGRAYAVAQCQGADLLVLHYVPEAA